MNVFTKVMLQILTLLRLVDFTEDNESITINNMTLINLFLIKLGPMSEVMLTKKILLFQILCSCVAFVIRYPLATYFYDK